MHFVVKAKLLSNIAEFCQCADTINSNIRNNRMFTCDDGRGPQTRVSQVWAGTVTPTASPGPKPRAEPQLFHPKKMISDRFHFLRRRENEE